MRATLAAVLVLCTVAPGAAHAAGRSYALETQWRAPGVAIAVDASSNVFVLGDGKVTKFDAHGRPVSQLAYDPAMSAHGLAVDAHGNIFISGQDPVTGYRRLDEYDGSGSLAGVIVGQGTANPMLGDLYSVAVDSEGNLYAGDNGNRILDKFNAAGQVMMEWGDRMDDHFPDLEFGTDGYLYVHVYRTTDHFPHSYVAKYSPGGAEVTTYSTPFDCSASGEPHKYSRATGVGVDVAGNVYVSDGCGLEIDTFANDGHMTGSFGAGALVEPGGLALDASSGSVFVLDGGFVKKFSPTGTTPVLAASWGQLKARWNNH
jgi:hypothetical protein